MNIKDIVANAINRARTKTDGTEEIELFLTKSNQLGQFDFKEVKSTLVKLVEQGALKEVKPTMSPKLLMSAIIMNPLSPQEDMPGAYFKIVLDSNFDKWIQKENITIHKLSEKIRNPDEEIGKVTFTSDGKILINKLLLTTLRNEGKNYIAFKYIYQNSNRLITPKEFEEKTGLDINFNDFLDNIGFKKDFRKIFFPIASKEGIKFINPVNEQRLFELGLPDIRL